MDANKAAIVTRSKQVSTEYAVKHLEEFIAASTTADGASSKGGPVRIGTDTAHQLHLVVQSLKQEPGAGEQ